jgi:hypothetical protein
LRKRLCNDQRAPEIADTGSIRCHLAFQPNYGLTQAHWTRADEIRDNVENATNTRASFITRRSVNGEVNS